MYDILILSAALATILFLVGFTVWVSIIALRNPDLGNGSGLSMGDAKGLCEN